MNTADIEKIKKNTKKLKLLYVEDNEQTRESTLLLFQRFFDDIITASDGKDGFAKFKKYQPNLIFTDINMPNMNGLQMIDAIHNYSNTDLPIVVFSAHDESRYLLDAIKSGVDGYLVKPVNLELFIEELYRIINNKYKIQKNLIQINSDYRWDKRAKKLYYQDKEIVLSKNEIALFELMGSNINIIYSDELILEQIWLDSFDANKSNIRNLLKRLNSKLPTKLIKNIYNVGYSFIL